MEMRCDASSTAMSDQDTDTKQVDRKRKAESFDELEIDLNASVPLSKKQKRLARKGKLEEEPAPKVTGRKVKVWCMDWEPIIRH